MLPSFGKVKAIYLLNPHRTSARQQADKKVEGNEKISESPRASYSLVIIKLRRAMKPSQLLAEFGKRRTRPEVKRAEFQSPLPNTHFVLCESDTSLSFFGLQFPSL